MRETGFNITPNLGIMSTPIYKSGEQLMQIDGFNMKLNSNENPLGSTQKAKDADENLRSKGILIRKVADYGLPKSLRISIGKEEEFFRLRDQIKNFMEEANAI